ncbi:MAG: hypothetical protein OEY97_07250 [Nitrospirota bacterium]|nr:hypothetical protein [Nitrospirota bacterium]
MHAQRRFPRPLTTAAVLLASLLGTAMPALAANSFLVAPGRVDMDLTRPRTQVFILTNNGDGAIRLTIEPIYFEVDSASLRAGEPLDAAASVQDDMTPWLRVSPRTVSLQPGERRNIRASVRPPADLPDGEYRAHLLVRMLEPARNMGPTGGDEALTMRLTLKMETAVAIYGHRGRRDGQITFGCHIGAGGELELVGVNRSIWRYEGTVRAYPPGTDLTAAPDSRPLFEQPVLLYRESRKATPVIGLKPPPGPLLLQWQAGPMGGQSGNTICTPEG